MRKCGNAEMRKCGNAEMRKCGNAEMQHFRIFMNESLAMLFFEHGSRYSR